jgi:hypothetical protein
MIIFMISTRSAAANIFHICLIFTNPTCFWFVTSNESIHPPIHPLFIQRNSPLSTAASTLHVISGAGGAGVCMLFGGGRSVDR